MQLNGKMDEYQKSIQEALQALPDLKPPPHVWSEVMKRGRPRANQPSRFFALSLAASLVIGVLWLPFLTTPEPSKAEKIIPYKEIIVKSHAMDIIVQNAPRIVVGDSPTQFVLAHRVEVIDDYLRHLPLDEIDLRTQLLKQRVNALAAYWTIQERRDTEALLTATY